MAGVIPAAPYPPPPAYTFAPTFASSGNSQPAISSGIAIAILTVLGAFILFSIIRFYNSCTDPTPENPNAINVRRPAAKKGLSAEIISSIPTRLYKESDANEECVVCLGDFDSIEPVKELPKCGHFFHVDCIDKWLSLRTTCPVCRLSLKPPSTNADAGRSSSVRGRSSARSLSTPEPDRELVVVPSTRIEGSSACPTAEVAGANSDHDFVTVELLDEPSELRASLRYRNSSVQSLTDGDANTGAVIAREEGQNSLSRRSTSVRIPATALNGMEDSDNMEDADLLSYLQANSTARSLSANSIHGRGSLLQAAVSGAALAEAQRRGCDTTASEAGGSEQRLNSEMQALTWGLGSQIGGSSRDGSEMSIVRDVSRGSGTPENEIEGGEKPRSMLSSFRARIPGLWGSETNNGHAAKATPSGPDAV